MQLHQLGLALDALPSPLTILDCSGVIVYVNKAWKQFSDSNGLAMADYGIGSNYLDYCDVTIIFQDFEPIGVAQGIRQVISGLKKEFYCQYPCHSPTKERWFQMRAVPFDQEDCRHVIIIHENITDSKTSENRLRNILDNAPIGMAIISLDGRFIEANQSLEAITGYSKAELLNLTCEQINHPDDLYLDEKLMQGLKQGTQSSYQVEKRFIHKNGNIIWISLTCSILRDEIGAPINIIKQIMNITEKVNIETALKNSEHSLNLIMNNIPALIGYWNKDLINEFGNKAYTEFFGIDSAKLNGMSLRDVVGEDLYRLNLPHIRMALQGKTQNFERTIKNKYGDDRYILASYIPEISEGSVKGFFVLVTDITQTKLTEKELLKSEQMSRIILSTSSDGFLFCDNKGKIIDVNPAFCDMLGYTSHEILNMSIIDIEASESAEEIKERFKKIINQGFDRFESKLRSKDGSMVDVEHSVTYLADKQLTFGFIRDITQRKQSEKLRLQLLEQQRDALVREVHHRIKNHLQGMVGLLNLYSSKQPAEMDLLQDISAKIFSIAAVYGVQGRHHQNTTYLCEITFEICKSLKIFGMSENNIKYSNFNIHRILLPSEYAVPVALIINELIINAIKHSADQMQRNIIVELTVKENMAILSVMNSCQECSPFPDFEHSTGLGVGLSLVDAILPKVGACLSLIRKQDRVYAQLILEPPVISLTDHSQSI